MEYDYTKATPSRLSKDAVYSLAESVANQLEFSPGGDLEPVLQKLGGHLKVKDFWDLSDDESGSIAVHAPGNFDIYVSSITSGLRDRFTIAHEIGHYILHYIYARSQGDELENMYATRYGNTREEWEANWFAAAFLMPEDDFRERYNRLNGSLASVAAELCVSEKAAKVRADVLGLT
ncbi:MAG: ImmA/IrrE family metallo-endopeptidase [Terasakiella sp.]|uniref:ImmA/IrrE family metallo-endopeptidase n=1 Tax=unclassified Terasakiella TaxID=2614952 RepID=UPI003B0050F3